MSLQFYDLQPSIDDFCAAVLHGLSQSPKAISAQFLDDQRHRLRSDLSSLRRSCPGKSSGSIRLSALSATP
ncbi:MAG: hypothetical protein F6K28_58950 [Microcoleus sp. SIO2G3]|nr:hypothetical protein [Microcoleus sp. SIO2G3]